VSCTTATDKTLNSKEDVERPFQVDMHKMYSALDELYPLMFSKSEFSSKKSNEKISKALRRLTNSSKVLSKKDLVSFAGKDPVVSLKLEQLRGNFERSEASFLKGDKEHSRFLLKSAVGQCYQCHSRGRALVTYSLNEKSSERFSVLNPFEKAEFLMATRRFEAAQKLLEDFILKPHHSRSERFVLERALTTYLFLTLVALDQPDDARSLIDRRLNLGAKYLEPTLVAWAKDLRTWGRAASRSQMDRELRRLLQEPDGYASLVRILKLRKSLYKKMSTENNKNRLARVYWDLGRVYQALMEVGYWEAPEVYYEACINKAPHSNISRRCFDSYRDHVLFGFTGSSGVHIPYDESMKLKRLKEKAL
jgi:tetratricopeptide (TPR) repeat protein